MTTGQADLLNAKLIQPAKLRTNGAIFRVHRRSTSVLTRAPAHMHAQDMGFIYLATIAFAMATGSAKNVNWTYIQPQHLYPAHWTWAA